MSSLNLVITRFKMSDSTLFGDYNITSSSEANFYQPKSEDFPLDTKSENWPPNCESVKIRSYLANENSCYYWSVGLYREDSLIHTFKIRMNRIVEWTKLFNECFKDNNVRVISHSVMVNLSPDNLQYPLIWIS